MYCRNCGAQIDDDALFCTKCGIKLTDNLHFNNCIYCGSSLKKDAVFCTQCGNRIKPEEPAIIDNDTNDIENNIEEQQKDARAVNKQTVQIEQVALSVESQIVEEKSIEEEQDDTKKQKIQSVALHNNTEIFNSDGISNNLTESETTSLNILKNRKKKFRLLFALTIIFLLSTIGTGVLAYWNYENWLNLRSKYDILSESYDRISQDNDSLTSAKYQLESDKKSLEDNYNALLESDVFVRVTKIYNSADNSTYLHHSKITYLDFDYTVSKSKDVKNSSPLYIKVIKPDGALDRGSSSPVGYSIKTTVNSNWSGWGSEKTGCYTAGYHMIEFWYNGRCVGRKKIYIN